MDPAGRLFLTRYILLSARFRLLGRGTDPILAALVFFVNYTGVSIVVDLIPQLPTLPAASRLCIATQDLRPSPASARSQEPSPEPVPQASLKPFPVAPQTPPQTRRRSVAATQFAYPLGQFVTSITKAACEHQRPQQGILIRPPEASRQYSNSQHPNSRYSSAGAVTALGTDRRIPASERRSLDLVSGRGLLSRTETSFLCATASLKLPLAPPMLEATIKRSI